ncbi:MAG: ribosome small subunit-dependent GTPase A [Bacteroidia bacterium]|nr:ribosome small subunit-dependent GTPase A [Bacteroidia bacterium]MDW8333684.1 ribosome small subunit-dependent GTPase A [Bacteroidia bacterium]
MSATKARVIRATGSHYRVVYPDGAKGEAILRGKMRLAASTDTNPVVVGDEVEVENGVILSVLPRRNYILRKSARSGARRQVMCANVDLVVVVACLFKPFCPLTFIDGVLATAEAYHIPAVVVFNKLDLLEKEEDWNKLEDLVEIYESVGYAVETVSALKPGTIAGLRERMRDRCSFLAGPSGVGKSTLVNALAPGLNLRVGEISHKWETGRHTTTFAEMHPLPFGGFVIDAPGVKEFLPTDMTPAELAQYYPEMRSSATRCRFNNCTHIGEPDCAVRTAVENGEIPATRYHTYLGLVESLRSVS